MRITFFFLLLFPPFSLHFFMKSPFKFFPVFQFGQKSPPPPKFPKWPEYISLREKLKNAGKVKLPLILRRFNEGILSLLPCKPLGFLFFALLVQGLLKNACLVGLGSICLLTTTTMFRPGICFAFCAILQTIRDI